jgi:hypothetical protein
LRAICKLDHVRLQPSAADWTAVRDESRTAKEARMQVQKRFWRVLGVIWLACSASGVSAQTAQDLPTGQLNPQVNPALADKLKDRFDIRFDQTQRPIVSEQPS